jgi:SPP1 gp7 family putative phage head morphogenesis protein
VAITAGTLRRLRALAAQVGGLVDDTVRALTRNWVRTWGDLTPAWRRAINDLVSAASTAEQWPAPWQLYRIPSVATAAVRTDAALAGLAAETGTATTAGASTIVAATAAAEPLIIASQLPASMAADAAAVYAARVLPTALDLIVRRATEQITSLTRPLGPAADEAVRVALIRGIAVGAHPERVARDMLNRVEGAFHGGLTRAIVIARTEMVDAHREASRYVHQANADVLAGWVWLSRLDRRACLACWVMHGSEFPVAEPGPAGHPQCRCARMPKVRPWRELGIPMDEPGDQLVDARARFDALDDADQLAVMGAARLRLLRSGAIGWNDLVVRRDNPGWRPSYAPRPVRDLQRLADRRAA